MLNNIPVHITPRTDSMRKKNLRSKNICNLVQIPRAKPFSNLTVHLWNADCLSNKTTTLLDHILLFDVDVMVVIETWFSEDDAVKIGECTPPSYEFLNFPRGSTTSGGGIGIIYKKNH